MTRTLSDCFWFAVTIASCIALYAMSAAVA
jgi:hypothetical protein